MKKRTVLLYLLLTILFLVATPAYAASADVTKIETFMKGVIQEFNCNKRWLSA